MKTQFWIEYDGNMVLQKPKDMLHPKLEKELSELAQGSYEMDIIMVPIDNSLLRGACLKKPGTKIVKLQ